jgi:hypothetical protein
VLFVRAEGWTGRATSASIAFVGQVASIAKLARVAAPKLLWVKFDRKPTALTTPGLPADVSRQGDHASEGHEGKILDSSRAHCEPLTVRAKPGLMQSSTLRFAGYGVCAILPEASAAGVAEQWATGGRPTEARGRGKASTAA